MLGWRLLERGPRTPNLGSGKVAGKVLWDWLMFGRLCRFMVKNGGLILHFKHHHIIEFIEKGAKGDA